MGSLLAGKGAAQSAQTAGVGANAETNAVIDQIKRAYDSPALAQQYTNYQDSLNQYYTSQVNQQQQVNARDLLFANARSGLTGGTQAANLNTTLNEEYKQGLLSAANTARSATNALEQANQSQENALISQAAGAGTTGVPAQLISQSQGANLSAAQGQIGAGALGSLFSGTAQAYTQEQQAAALAQILKTPTGGAYGGNQASLYGVPGQ